MKLYLGLINLHFCFIVPLLINYFNPDNGFVLCCIWFVMYILLFILGRNND